MALTNQTAEPPDRRSGLRAAAIEVRSLGAARAASASRTRPKRARFSPALIYHHFGEPSALLESALEHLENQADIYTARSGALAWDTLWPCW
jgi:hypothetical protein